MPLAAFERMLDVHGADRARWPMVERAAALQLLASNADAQRLLAEAVAFEAVLARGAEASGDAAALARLTDRIVAASQAGPRLAVSAQPASSVVAISRKAVPPAEWRRAAALLAASLMIGVFVGQTQIAASAVPKLAALAGLSVSTNEQMAQADLDIDAPELD